MKWSLKLGRVAGIGIFVHWTFFLLPAYLAISGWQEEQAPAAILHGILLVLAVFGCVVLHELGHALTARRYGIGTRDITLLPIGGVARLERMPENPGQEFWVAIAGPAVNLAIAAVLFLVLWLMYGLPRFEPPDNAADFGYMIGWPLFPFELLLLNLMLIVFNMIPAFPMDGGRVLRALLAMRLPYVRATQIAATIGQTLAVVCGTLAFFGQAWQLVLVCCFVYLGAQGEAHMVRMQAILRGVPVRDAMLTRFRTLREDDSLATAVGELLASSQQDFPVERDGQVVGALLRADLFRALAEGRREARVGDVMLAGCQTVLDTEMLDDTFLRMREKNCSMLPVLRGGALVGLVTLENVGEWLMVQSALQKAAAVA